MNKFALHHIPKSNYAFACSENKLCIRLRTAKNDIDKINLVIGNKVDWNIRQTYQMSKILSDCYFDYYECIVEAEDTRIGYYFELFEDDKIIIYTESGISKTFDHEKSYQHYFQFPYINRIDVHTVPSWVNEAVFYQIFVERFNNGNPDNSPPNLSEWGTPPLPKSFFGGDIQGITKKIDYLRELGINGIYLTPIFESPSNHKYDTTDYRKIDPYFGTEEDFRTLVEKAHKNGIKIILDAVFNHCGYFFEPFQDVIKNGKESKYADWFYISEFPVCTQPINYKTFSHVYSMPKLNTANPEVKKYLLDAACYWTEKFDIDGWRLDVSDEIDHYFWRSFRKTIKEINSEAIIVGENWHDAYPWLMGDQFDGVMNYSVTKSCISYFAEKNINAEQFSYELSDYLIRNSNQANQAMLNLLDSHDTVRFLTLCNNNKQSLKNAAIFLFGYLGIPCTYYGTEIGMNGNGEPDCRKTFNWDTASWDMDLLDFYKKLIAIRKSEKVLQEGTICFSSTKDLLVMIREYQNTKITIVINNTDITQKYNTSKAFDLIHGENTEGIINILPQSAVMLKEQNK